LLAGYNVFTEAKIPTLASYKKEGDRGGVITQLASQGSDKAAPAWGGGAVASKKTTNAASQSMGKS